MKSSLATLVLCVIGGCAFDGAERIDTAGDHPAFGKVEPMTPAARDAEVDTGRLLVDSPRGYTVYDEGGRKVARETNQAVGGAEGPVELKLAPGRFFVRLDEPVLGPRDFWVTVERAKVTRVDNKSRSDTPPAVR